ncbi:MAG: hypothetical protein NTV01_14630 [Bacteroidia bacterium]|nr:hypothetical protein [Bacteroidia bacterium]
MDETILKEIKKIRILLAELTGTADLPATERFSKEAIAKAAKEFRVLAIQRGEWIPGHEIKKVIRSAPWNCSKVIEEALPYPGFSPRYLFDSLFSPNRTIGQG